MSKATVTGKRQITIPMEICEKLDINTGNQVEFIISDDVVIFQKVKPKEEDFCPYCQELVYKSGGHVNYEGRVYHLDCWYNSRVNGIISLTKKMEGK